MGWLQRLTSSTAPSGHDQAASFLLNFEASFGATHPAFAAAAPALAPHAQWGGLEPWYAASLQPDWLAALAS